MSKEILSPAPEQRRNRWKGRQRKLLARYREAHHTFVKLTQQYHDAAEVPLHVVEAAYRLENTLHEVIYEQPSSILEPRPKSPGIRERVVWGIKDRIPKITLPNISRGRDSQNSGTGTTSG